MACSAAEPKRAPTAYFLWLAENREALAKEVGGGKAPLVSKLGGERWKALTEAEKAPWEKQAKEAKAQYEKEVEAFKSGGGEVGKRRREAAEARAAKSGKKARKGAKDPGCPKKPPNAYFLWFSENRGNVAKDVSGVEGRQKNAAVVKLAAERFKSLSASQKAVWEKKATEAKAAYDKALEEYKKSGGQAAEGEDGEEGGEEGDDGEQ